MFLKVEFHWCLKAQGILLDSALGQETSVTVAPKSAFITSDWYVSCFPSWLRHFCHGFPCPGHFQLHYCNTLYVRLAVKMPWTLQLIWMLQFICRWKPVEESLLTLFYSRFIGSKCLSMPNSCPCHAGHYLCSQTQTRAPRGTAFSSTNLLRHWDRGPWRRGPKVIASIGFALEPALPTVYANATGWGSHTVSTDVTFSLALRSWIWNSRVVGRQV